MSTETRPEWIQPGTAVLLYSLGYHNSGKPHDIQKTTIARVATKSFTVAKEREPRFRIDRCAVNQGGSWGWTRHVVPADSDKAREVLDWLRRKKLINRAEAACEAWRRSCTRENRIELITALQEIED